MNKHITQPKETMSNSLFEITKDDYLRTLYAKRDRLSEIRTRLAENLEERKTLRTQAVTAEADLMASLGGGVQSDMADLNLPSVPGASLGPASASVDDLRGQRRLDAEARAIVALRACGGQATNVGLAALLGINSHGLEGLLRGSMRIKKMNTGRMGNEQTNWVLVEDGGK